MPQDQTPPPPPAWQPPPGWQPHPPAGPSPSHARVGLLVGLVLVLLLACGGLAFASWQLIGARDASTVAGPSIRPATSSPGDAAPSPSPVEPSPVEPSAVPAGSAAVPFGTAHTVIWPDHLVGYVLRARHNDLPEDQLAIHPGDISVNVEVTIVNNSAVDVVVTPATMRMSYGPEHAPADHYDGSISHTGDGFFGVVHPGHTAYGEFHFAVPPQYMTQLVIELVPRPGDAPGLFAGSVD